jgi:hypothetical protein
MSYGLAYSIVVYVHIGGIQPFTIFFSVLLMLGSVVLGSVV